MIKEIWTSFPQVLEKKVNSLLDEAQPNSLKAFHLFKACQRDDLWDQDFEAFFEKIRDFFLTPNHMRSKGALDQFLLRPMSVRTFDDFRLTFRTAQIEENQIQEIADWASQIIRLSRQESTAVASKSVLLATLKKITNPTGDQKDEQITFEDFCEAWKKVVFNLFGLHKIYALNELLRELRRLKAETEKEQDQIYDDGFFPTIYLTQTEISWVIAVRESVTFDEKIPPFPLARGPQKQRLVDLERTIRLFRIVQTTHLEELLVHKRSIRLTLLDRCERLLAEKAR